MSFAGRTTLSEVLFTEQGPGPIALRIDARILSEEDIVLGGQPPPDQDRQRDIRGSLYAPARILCL
jgi:hypothetical protein